MEWSTELANISFDCLEPISVVDAEGKYLHVNKTWLEFCHMDEGSIGMDDICKLHPWDLFPNSKVRQVLEDHAFLCNSSEQYARRSGVYLYYPLFREGEFIGVLIICHMGVTAHERQLIKHMETLSTRLKNTEEQLSSYNSANFNLNSIVGESAVMRQLRSDILSAGKTNSTVLIEGETGTGKELVARAIHEASSRAERHMVCINCSAVPSELMESEFFGYESGSFTGADRRGKKGKFELAQNSSIFLDEINQMPLQMQPKLLRVLQEHEIERIGGKAPTPINARFIAATNMSLQRMVEEGNFRSDLYYRLNVVRIHIPPLRERKEDIRILCRALVSRLNSQLGMSCSCSDPVFSLLESYDWPGNVRELQNVLERAMNVAAGDNMLTLRDFEDFRREMLHGQRLYLSPPTAASASGISRVSRQKIELMAALEESSGNRAEAARMLGISRTALYNRMLKYGIK